MLPIPLVGWGEDKPPLQTPSSTSSASHFVVFGDSRPMCPSQNNFLDPPLRAAADREGRGRYGFVKNAEPNYSQSVT